MGKFEVSGKYARADMDCVVFGCDIRCVIVKREGKFKPFVTITLPDDVEEGINLCTENIPLRLENSEHKNMELLRGYVSQYIVELIEAKEKFIAIQYKELSKIKELLDKNPA